MSAARVATSDCGPHTLRLVTAVRTPSVVCHWRGGPTVVTATSRRVQLVTTTCYQLAPVRRAGPITSTRYGAQLRSLQPAAQTLVGSAHFLLYTTVADWVAGAQLCGSIGGALAYYDTSMQ